jgi:hypothetical protein
LSFAASGCGSRAKLFGALQSRHRRHAGDLDGAGSEGHRRVASLRSGDALDQAAGEVCAARFNPYWCDSQSS